jgi:hypothetical protein
MIEDDMITLSKFENIDYVIVEYSTGEKFYTITLEEKNKPKMVSLNRYTYFCYKIRTSKDGKELPEDYWLTTLIPVKWIIRLIIAPKYEEVKSE